MELGFRQRCARLCVGRHICCFTGTAGLGKCLLQVNECTRWNAEDGGAGLHQFDQGYCQTGVQREVNGRLQPQWPGSLRLPLASVVVLLPFYGCNYLELVRLRN